MSVSFSFCFAPCSVCAWGALCVSEVDVPVVRVCVFLPVCVEKSTVVLFVACPLAFFFCGGGLVCCAVFLCCLIAALLRSIVPFVDLVDSVVSCVVSSEEGTVRLEKLDIQCVPFDLYISNGSIRKGMGYYDPIVSPSLALVSRRLIASPLLFSSSLLHDSASLLSSFFRLD